MAAGFFSITLSEAEFGNLVSWLSLQAATATTEVHHGSNAHPKELLHAYSITPPFPATRRCPTEPAAPNSYPVKLKLNFRVAHGSG